MIQSEFKDPQNGRLYKALQDGDKSIPIGPPEDLVDALGLPEPFATNLHNALYRRGIFSYEDLRTRQRELEGALREAYQIDSQRLYEAFYNLQKEEVPT